MYHFDVYLQLTQYCRLCMHACSVSHVQLFVIPWIVVHQAPLSVGLSWQEYWSWLPFPPPGDLPYPGTIPTSPAAPALSGRFFTTEPPWIKTTVLQFSSVQSLSRVWLFATPWTAAHQASLSVTNSQSLLKLMSIELVMPSIQPSHPLSSPSSLAFSLPQHQGFF